MFTDSFIYVSQKQKTTQMSINRRIDKVWNIRVSTTQRQKRNKLITYTDTHTHHGRMSETLCVEKEARHTDLWKIIVSVSKGGIDWKMKLVKLLERLTSLTSCLRGWLTC